MSAVTGISGSSSASTDYAMQLAQTSALKRTLNSLGTAVQNGDMTSAGSILTGFIKANPQYTAATSDGAQTQAPINQGFQTLADAISNNQSAQAQSAWAQIRSDLSTSGVTDLGDGAADTQKLLANTKASISQQIVSDALGTSSAGSSSVASLLGGSSDSSSGVGWNSILLNNWLTYQAGGSTTPTASAASTGTKLNTAA